MMYQFEILLAQCWDNLGEKRHFILATEKQNFNRSHHTMISNGSLSKQTLGNLGIASHCCCDELRA
jgi:hypothetical protein